MAQPCQLHATRESCAPVTAHAESASPFQAKVGRFRDFNGQFPVESRCGAVIVGVVDLLPPLSSGGAQVTSP